ncbi:SipW-dependent-type signal peptide-containing protein [Halorarius halobius]|uniref:SipW-dependent-type signal peptide-containing protein n=1 Tax=Halorarius halobius TaxID=2962671 RepID=UPI0020CDEB90|nr:SipW-dependent-type signal peptide-containing protein [Halorarius halobius]
MTQDTEPQPKLYDLSRRKMLAGLGAVGLASAGAGFGTSALFSDREEFAGNSITAGELDLLVDWQQHYSYTMGGDPVVTYVNAHPDHDGDGEQSIVDDGVVVRYSDEDRNLQGLDCENIPPLDQADFGSDPVTGDAMDTLVQFSDVKPGDEGEITFSLHLCDNPGYIWMQAANVTESGGATNDAEALVDPDNLPDLADAIEATLWYDEDCDNVRDGADPADIMLTLDFSGSMLYDQYGGVVSTDSIQVNGTTYDETTKIDLVELGAKEFIDYLQLQGSDVQVGVAYFDGEGSSDTEPRVGILQELTADLSVVDAALSDLRQKLANVVTGVAADGVGSDPNASDPADGDGDPDPYSNANGIATGTYIGEGVDAAQAELASVRARSGVDYANIVLSDGESFNGTGSTTFSSPEDAADDARATAPAPATDVYTISVGSANDAVLQEMAGEAGDSVGDDPAYFYDVDDPVNVPSVFGNIAARFGGEKIIMQDTLGNVIAELADGNGIPLDGNRATAYDELSDPATDPDRDPFRGDGVMHCVALAWELPVEVGNEIQGDSLGFDLGFYTEQARNNDGSGPVAT